jgi:hypothetical protein
MLKRRARQTQPVPSPLVGEGAERTKRARRVRGILLAIVPPPLTRLALRAIHPLPRGERASGARGIGACPPSRLRASADKPRLGPTDDLRFVSHEFLRTCLFVAARPSAPGFASPSRKCEGVERRKAPPRSHPPSPVGLRRAAPVTRARRLPALHLRLFCPRDRSFRVHTEGSCPPDPASFRRPSCAPRPAIQGRPP